MIDEINLILNDRESGSVALLNRLISALENELQVSAWNPETFSPLLISLRKKLHHFAAIENFLASLTEHSRKKDAFPGEALRFISDYKVYWQDSPERIADHFLLHGHPGNKTLLTHSHSQTILYLLNQLHLRKIPFSVLQTLSSPGEEGRKSLESMHQLRIKAELIDDKKVKEVLPSVDIILVGCDAMLAHKFLNKIGTKAILVQARQLGKASFLVTESRKEITRPDWEKGWTKQAQFEWIPRDLADWMVNEKSE